MFILFLIQLVSFRNQALEPNITIYLGPVYPEPFMLPQPSYLVYDQDKYSPNFKIDNDYSFNCQQSNLTFFNATDYDRKLKQNQLFTIPMSLTNNEKKLVQIHSIDITNYFEDQNLQSTISKKMCLYSLVFDKQYILAEDTIQLNINHLCKATLNIENYWSVIDIYIKFFRKDPISFQYQFICDQFYFAKRFDFSTLILLFSGSLIILILSRMGKIISFKRKIRFCVLSIENDHPFQGFLLNFKYSMIYIFIILIFSLIAYFFQISYIIQEVLVTECFCSLLTIFYLDEVLCLTSKHLKFMKKKCLCRIRISEIISVLLTGIIYSIYYYYQKPWFVSDLLSICIIGSFLKLMKFKSMRDAVSFYIPTILIDCLAKGYMIYFYRYTLNSDLIKYFNTPFLAQITFFHFKYNQTCYWISLVNIVLPGYTYRFDMSKQTFVYEIISFASLLGGLSLWFGLEYVSKYPLPVSIFTEIPMIIFSCLISFKRGELKQLWKGTFYDQEIMDPFQNEMELSSVGSINIGVKKEEKEIVHRQAIVNNFIIDPKLFEGL